MRALFLRLALTPYSIPAAPLPGPMCRFHALPRASTHPEPWRPHPRLAPVPPSTQRPFLVCVLRYLAFSALFHPEFPENAAQYLPDDLGADAKPHLCAAISNKTGLGAGLKTRKRSTQIGEGGGQGKNETSATGEGVRMRCRQVSVDKHKARPASVCCDIRRNRAQTWPKNQKTQHSTCRMT